MAEIRRFDIDGPRFWRSRERCFPSAWRTETPLMLPTCTTMEERLAALADEGYTGD